MDRARYLEHVQADGVALAAVARADPGAAVRSCPGWTEADLVGHVGRVYHWVTGVVEAGTADPPTGERATPPTGAAAVPWYEQRLARLLATLGAINLGAPAWNWSLGPQVAGFWLRRMAQETAVHRWDGDDAVGAARPIDADLAADGIDEWIAVHLAADVAEDEAAVDAVTGPLGLASTDRPARWLARLAGHDLDVARDDDADVGAAGVVVRAPASDLLLVLWGRRPPASVEVDGDPALLEVWLALAEN